MCVDVLAPVASQLRNIIGILPPTRSVLWAIHCPTSGNLQSDLDCMGSVACIGERMRDDTGMETAVRHTRDNLNRLSAPLRHIFNNISQ